jgi:hypothetical protein
MTEDEIKFFRDMKQELESQRTNRRNPGPWVSVVVGLSIAVVGNFVGWFANKSQGDIESVTKITQSLEYLRTDLQEMKADLTKRDEEINHKLDASFSRDEFEREMQYRDADFTRMRQQIDAIYIEIDKRNK